MRFLLRAVVFCILGLSLAAQQSTFADVGLLQRAAVPILSTVEWEDLGSGLGFYGLSKMELPSTAFVPSTVKYSISGKTRNRVDKVLIAAFVASARDLTAGRAKTEAVATQWFKSVQKPVPTGLVAAIKAGKPFRSAAGGLSIQYVVERGAGTPIKQPDGSLYQCTMMDLTIKPL